MEVKKDSLNKYYIYCYSFTKENYQIIKNLEEYNSYVEKIEDYFFIIHANLFIIYENYFYFFKNYNYDDIICNIPLNYFDIILFQKPESENKINPIKVKNYDEFIKKKYKKYINISTLNYMNITYVGYDTNTFDLQGNQNVQYLIDHSNVIFKTNPKKEKNKKCTLFLNKFKENINYLLEKIKLYNNKIINSKENSDIVKIIYNNFTKKNNKIMFFCENENILFTLPLDNFLFLCVDDVVKIEKYTEYDPRFGLYSIMRNKNKVID